MKKSPPNPDAGWHCGGWADHQRTRFDATKGTTLLERLLWLEEATAFARALSGARVVPPPAFAMQRHSSFAEDVAAYGVKRNDGGTPPDHPA